MTATRALPTGVRRLSRLLAVVALVTALGSVLPAAASPSADGGTPMPAGVPRPDGGKPMPLAAPNGPSGTACQKGANGAEPGQPEPGRCEDRLYQGITEASQRLHVAVALALP